MSVTPRDARIAAIEAREKAATPGPWDREPADDVWIANGHANFEFLHHARADVPWMIADRRELEADNAQLRTALKKAKKAIHSEYCGEHHHPYCVAVKNALEGQ